MPKAVRFDEFGGPDVLNVVDAPRPAAGRGQAVVRVKMASINPGEASIRRGLLEKQFPTTFPSGEGSDLAGVVEEVEENEEGEPRFSVRDEVIGFTDNRASHAELVLVEVDKLIRRPGGVPWEQAGSLFVVGTTAFAAVRAVSVQQADTLVISGAAGGVGSIALQLAKNIGAKVIGVANDEDREWVERHGAVFVTASGDNLIDRVRIASGGKADAFIDTVGANYVDVAIALGVARDRINTTINFAAVEKYGVKAEGSHTAANAQVLATLADSIDKGRLEIRIAKVYPLTSVREAFEALEQHRARGKIVLSP